MLYARSTKAQEIVSIQVRLSRCNRMLRSVTNLKMQSLQKLLLNQKTWMRGRIVISKQRLYMVEL